MRAVLALVPPLLLLPATIQAASDSVPDAVMQAAAAFVASLDAEQRARLIHDFGDQGQRVRWSNFPTGVVPRGGVSLRQLNAVQREAAMKLLGTVLSPAGLRKVDEIRQADDDFKANGSKRGPRGGGGGPPPGRDGTPPDRGPSAAGGAGRQGFAADDLFGADLYYISFLGTPSATRPWMLQFGGHHLALNLTLAGSKGVLTPTLTGAQPAAFVLNGRTVRPLGAESDKALRLLQSLDPSQRRRAVLDYAVPDLVLGPGQDGKTIVPDGLKASEMTVAQRARLRDVIAEWAGIVDARLGAARMAQLEADLGETWFAWSGPVDGQVGRNIAAYYRIQGPHLVIEYAPQSDEPGNHVHTIYRDPTDDYGRSTLKP